MKFLAFFFFLVLSLQAQTINFSEEKYIDAIGQSILKKGILKISKDKVELKYKNSSKILVNIKDKLVIKDDKEIQHIDLKNQIALKMIFLLIKSIYNKNYENLNEFFTMQSKNEVFKLIPKEDLKNYIDFIEFKKGEKLEFLTIYMKNKNKTTIREIDD
jgi:hypothetical protein